MGGVVDADGATQDLCEIGLEEAGVAVEHGVHHVAQDGTANVAAEVIENLAAIYRTDLAVGDGELVGFVIIGFDVNGRRYLLGASNKNGPGIIR